jgi:hypothetical protein
VGDVVHLRVWEKVYTTAGNEIKAERGESSCNLQGLKNLSHNHSQSQKEVIMSAQMKRTGIKSVGILAVTLFVFLMFFNFVFVPRAGAKINCGTVCWWDPRIPDCRDQAQDCVGCWWDNNPVHCSNN